MKRSELKKRIAENPFAVLGEIVYQSLYEDIISLRIAPGSKLNESRIAEELGISRTPVKTALTQLEKDNLLLKKGGTICVVSPMTKEESRQLFEARIAIEGYAVYLAAKRIAQSELSELEQLVTQYSKIGDCLEPVIYAECDHKFHALIIKASRNTYIQKMYATIEKRLLHYRHCLLPTIGAQRLQPILTQAAKHHQILFNAIRLGFSDTARNEMEVDISGMTNVFSEWQ